MLLRSLSRSQKQDYEPQVNPALTQYPGLSRLYLHLLFFGANHGGHV